MCRSPPSSSIVAIAPPAEPTVNSTVLPSGRISGQIAGPDPASGLGVPPDASTVKSPAPRRANTILFPGPQLPPMLNPGTVQIFSGAPPALDTFWRAPPAKYPTQRPSGEKK